MLTTPQNIDDGLFVLLPVGLNNVLVARDSSTGAPPALTPSRPPGFDPQIYLSVPIFNRRADLLALIISFMVFSWICSVFRLYIRLIVLRAPGWDDFFMSLALLCTTVGSIFLCIAPNYGYGKSMYTLTFPEIEEAIKFLYISTFPYPPSVTFMKIAILFQYLRIFKAGSTNSLVCKYLIVAVSLWGSLFAIVRWVPCVPIVAYWDYSVVGAKCWGLGSRRMGEFMSFYVGQAVSTSALDFVIFMLPIRLYFNGDTERRARIALLCLFGLGLCIILCSVWRMVFVIGMYTAGSLAFDPTWYSPTTAGLAWIEAHLAVACAAMPVFWPKLEDTWNKIFVTQTVSVTTEYGQFPSRVNDVELQSMSSDKGLAPDTPEMAEGWEPFVGDETSGLGISETIIESLSGASWSRKLKDRFRKPSEM